MALAGQKKGGPYPKEEQEERRNQVYNLHFEKGYSAVKIAEMLRVNRNTINADIRFWYSQISGDMDGYDINTWLSKRLNRLEYHRDVLLDSLEKTDSPKEIVSVEKALTEIDDRIESIISKISTEENLHEVEEDLVIEVVKRLLNKDYDFFNMQEPKIKEVVIEMTKCDWQYANLVFKKMLNLGMTLCETSYIESPRTYDILKFAKMRSILPDSEIKKLKKQNRLINYH